MRRSGKGSGGGPGMNKIVRPGVRTGAAREHIHPGGVAQLGQKVGDHTRNGSTGYRGEPLDGPKQPISVKLGNEVAKATVAGPGGSRTVMRTGAQGLHGSADPGKPTPRRDILSEFGPDSPMVRRR
jgi:hypothetical protein